MSSAVVTPEQLDLVLRAIYDVADGRALQSVKVSKVAQYAAVPDRLVWESLSGFDGWVVADPAEGVYLTGKGVEAVTRISSDVIERPLEERWSAMEFAILERTQRAERLETPVDEYVTSDLLGLRQPEFLRVAAAMLDQGWLQGGAIRVAEILAPIDVRIEGLTTAGRAELRRRWPARPADMVPVAAELVTNEVRASVEGFLTRFDHALDAGQLDALDKDVRTEVATDVECLRMQLRSPRPKRRVWASLLNAIGTVLVQSAAGVVGAEALQLLNQIHL